MGQISVEITASPGSLLSGNQQSEGLALRTAVSVSGIVGAFQKAPEKKAPIRPPSGRTASEQWGTLTTMYRLNIADFRGLSRHWRTFTAWNMVGGDGLEPPTLSV
jgi:hypothetical protein